MSSFYAYLTFPENVIESQVAIVDELVATQATMALLQVTQGVLVPEANRDATKNNGIE